MNLKHVFLPGIIVGLLFLFAESRYSSFEGQKRLADLLDQNQSDTFILSGLFDSCLTYTRDPFEKPCLKDGNNAFFLDDEVKLESVFVRSLTNSDLKCLPNEREIKTGEGAVSRNFYLALNSEAAIGVLEEAHGKGEQGYLLIEKSGIFAPVTKFCLRQEK